MPSVRFDESWVPGFRSAVRTSTAEGWSIREHRGGRVPLRGVNSEARLP